MKYCVGVDVSKTQLDVDWIGEAKVHENEEKAIKDFVEELLKLQTEGKLELVVCEATGGYEQKLVRHCHEANLPVHVAHANKVRHFAKSKGLLAKTDKIDAQILSEYGVLLKPEADELLLNKSTEKIGKVLKRRDQLISDRKRDQTRLDKELDEDVKQSINDHIGWLDKEIKKQDAVLKELSQAEEVKQNYELLTSIPSIGWISACYLLSCLPEVGKLSSKALSSLVGVAPYNNDSGKGQGRRRIQGGRSHLREVLYMVSMSAIRCNGDLRAFYKRLKEEKGKPTKVALTAVIRKLLGVINSVIKRQTPWVDFYQT